MSTFRQDRRNEEIAKALSEILRSVKDWRLADIVLGISGVSAAPDLLTARVYYSYIGQRDKKEVQKGLESASRFIRSSLADILDMRHTPKLIFIYDDSYEHGARIAELMHDIEKELEESDRKSDSDGEDDKDE